MVKKLFIGIIILALGFLGGAATFMVVNATHTVQPIAMSAVVSTEGNTSFSSIIEDVSPSVVNISTSRLMGPDAESENPLLDLFNNFVSPYIESSPAGEWTEYNTGSGVIVSSDGYIITNNHVVTGADEIKVTLYDKKTYRASMVGADPKTDLAVVKISSDGLPTIPWGDSDKLMVGDFVLAIGNPYSLNNTVTLGIISAVGRANVGIADIEDFIQTDAAINPGNSGGPLVNARGQIAGINTAIFTKSGGYQGIGFAVPSNMARVVMEQLLKEGKIVRGWLGITMQELTPALAVKLNATDGSGVLISDVTEGSPAEEAGIKRGDVITAFGGKEVHAPTTLKRLSAEARPGSKVDIVALRGGKQILLKAVIREQTGSDGGSQGSASKRNISNNALAGLKVMELTKDIARQLGMSPSLNGVVITNVEAGSPSELSGLKRGDVVLEIETTPIKEIDDFNYAAKTYGNQDTLLLYLNREGKRFYLALEKAY